MNMTIIAELLERFVVAVEKQTALAEKQVANTSRVIDLNTRNTETAERLLALREEELGRDVPDRD